MVWEHLHIERGNKTTLREISIDHGGPQDDWLSELYVPDSVFFYGRNYHRFLSDVASSSVNFIIILAWRFSSWQDNYLPHHWNFNGALCWIKLFIRY
jgi:hypothetical protein